MFLLRNEMGADDRILKRTFILERISPDVGGSFFASYQLNDLLVIAHSVESVYVIVENLQIYTYKCCVLE
ncbi:hypothetical protein [Pseudomonas sp. 44 R 15]|nr:hypothetical protein [Pseudomonas sp. 44 R 15]